MSKKYTLSAELHTQIARQLLEAEEKNSPIPVLTQTYPGMTEDDAYAIQWEGLRLRREQGEVVTGRKTGLTSRAVMEQLGWYSPDYAYITASTFMPEGTICKRSELNAPLVEGELAFIMGEDLDKAYVTVADIMNATSWVVPCIEICDTRYPSWKGVTALDSISDRAAGAKYILGSTPKRLNEINPRYIGMVVEKNGNLLGSAAGAEVLGSPVYAVAWLANQLTEYGEYLKKGDVILSGASMYADAAQAGDQYVITLDGFPSLSVKFE